jgi:Rha family phage regulatory protein
MNNLVEVDRSEVFCDSSIVAKKFGQKHAYVVDNIKKLLSDIEGLRVGTADPKAIIEEREYRGQKFNVYLMNRPFFSLLAMRFRGKRALEWQLKFNSAFYEMEKRIIQGQMNETDTSWISSREQGKLARLYETDTIKRFVEYATEQGSKSAQYYYKHITNATYKALGFMAQKEPKLRDSMNIYEVSQLLLAEKLAKDKLIEYMELGRNYKDIYQSVKEDLIRFSDAMRLS